MNTKTMKLFVTGPADQVDAMFRLVDVMLDGERRLKPGFAADLSVTDGYLPNMTDHALSEWYGDD